MDWNSDGKKDLVIGESYTNGRVRIYINAGTDAAPVFNGFTYLQTNGTDFMAVNQAAPEIGDWNGDARKDFVCGHVDGQIFLLLNSGTDGDPLFNSSAFVQNAGTDLNVGWRSSPVFTDWNGDGKKDLLVGSYDGDVCYFQNNGSTSSPSFSGYTALTAGGQTINVGTYSRIEVADLNKDGLDDLLVGSEDGSVWYFRCINPACPELALVNWFVNDSSGNTNSVLNPGETVQFIVGVSNSSSLASNVVIELIATSSYLTLTESQVNIGNMSKGQYARNSREPFCIRAATNAPLSSSYVLTLRISSEGCPETRSFSVSVCGYAMNTNASFSWIDTSGGSTVPMTDESSVLLPLGFSFCFYGTSWSNVYLMDNGFLVFGSPVYQYSNHPIPKMAPPNGFMAPFWDDMDPSSGGAVRCLWAGVAPDRYCVVEWNQVPRYSEGGLFTYEVIVYENGRIKFQYGPMSGAASDGSSATIGLEDYEGDHGMVYSCNAPDAVHNGLAIEFDQSGSFVDEDEDGMSDHSEMFYFGSTAYPAEADNDNDGRSNLDEVRCGTDPAAASSVLRCESIRAPAPGQLAIEWQSVSGKRYNIQCRTNMLIGAWSNLTPGPLDSSGSYTATVGSAKQNYYRVSVP